jgi:hypothetical protein
MTQRPPERFDHRGGLDCAACGCRVRLAFEV